MTGIFSSQCEEVAFYCSEYEESLLSEHGFKSADFAPCSTTPTMTMSTLPLEDPCYFMDFAEPSMEPYLPSFAYEEPCDLKSGMEDPTYSEDKDEDYRPPASKRKRGRPQKSGSSSKMAKYSREYRESKKKELVSSQSRAARLEQENEDLKSQLKEMTNYVRRMEIELARLRRSQQYCQVPIPY